MPGRATNEPSNYFAFGFQPAKDTEASTFVFTKHLDGTGLELDEQIEGVREGGDGQEVGFFHKTAVSMDGDMVTNVRPETGARSIAAFLGVDSVAPGVGAASGVAQVHTSVPTSSIPYLTVEQRWADELERISNVQMSSAVVEFEAGRPLKLTHSMVAGGTPVSRPVASALTPARETNKPLFYPGASVVLDGAPNSKMTKGKVELTRSFDTDIRTNQLFREDVVALNLDSDISGTLKYEDSALYDKVHFLGSGKISPNALDLATGSLKIYAEQGAGASLRFFEANVPLFNYTQARVNKLDPDGKTMYIDFVGMGLRGATHQFISRIQTASGGAFF